MTWPWRRRRSEYGGVVGLVVDGKLIFATADRRAVRAVERARDRAARARGMTPDEIAAQILMAPRVGLDFEDVERARLIH